MAQTATVQIQMPEMGESVTEGIVLEWHVAEGDFVNEGDTVVEVSTDKVDAEVPAPTDGVITKLIARSTMRCRSGRPWPRWSRARTGFRRGFERSAAGPARTRRPASGRRPPPPRHPQKDRLNSADGTKVDGDSQDVGPLPWLVASRQSLGSTSAVSPAAGQGRRSPRRTCSRRPTEAATGAAPRRPRPARRRCCGGRRRCSPRRWTRAARCPPRPRSARSPSTPSTPSARR